VGLRDDQGNENNPKVFEKVHGRKILLQGQLKIMVEKDSLEKATQRTKRSEWWMAL
jgi:hypothetical protein